MMSWVPSSASLGEKWSRGLVGMVSGRKREPCKAKPRTREKREVVGGSGKESLGAGGGDAGEAS